MGQIFKGNLVIYILSMFSIDASARTTKVVVIPIFGDHAAAKWRGPWGDDVDYMKGDIVEEDGSSHIAKERHTSKLSDIPPDATYWDLVAASGANGLDGITGDPGNDGAPGAEGDKGDPGTAATLTVGSTTTGNPETDASVTNSGTTSAAILNFTIPKGEKGDKGVKGDTGLFNQAALDAIMPQLLATRQYLYVYTKTAFATSTLYTGDLVTAANNLNNGTTYTDGAVAGDALCQSRAVAGGLPGTVKAWLSSPATAPAIRFTGASVRYVLPTLEKIADDTNDWY